MLSKSKYLTLKQIPKTADITIIGGGVVGSSILYHLRKIAPHLNTILLEKNLITSGATWHAAGLTTYYHGGNNFRFWHKETLDFLHEKKDQYDLSFHSPGSIRLIDEESYGRREEALYQLGKSTVWSSLFGGDDSARLIGPEEIVDLHPLVNIEGILGGFFTENDGHVDPSSVTRMYCEEAKLLSREHVIFENSQVTKLRHCNNVYEITVNNDYTFLSEKIVNCSGLWSRVIGELLNISVPAVVLQHQYVITESIPELRDIHVNRGSQLPVLRDLKNSYYLRDEGDGFLIGPYESSETVEVISSKDRPNWYSPGINDDEYYLFDEGLDRLLPHISGAVDLIPSISTVGIKNVVNGPTCWPSDGNHLVGPSVEFPKTFFHACAESYGIAHSYGIGSFIARWMINGEAPYELFEADPSRFGDFTHYNISGVDWVSQKVTETYGWNNTVSFPNENRPAARPILNWRGQEHIYRLLEERGSQFSFHYGYEAPNWFKRENDDHLALIPNYPSVDVQSKYVSFHRPEYHNNVHLEIKKLLTDVGVCYWPFSKFILEGERSHDFLNFLFSRKISKIPGKTQLSHSLSPTGKIHGEMMVNCLSGEGDSIYNYSDKNNSDKNNSNPSDKIKYYLLGYADYENYDYRNLSSHLDDFNQRNQTEIKLRNITENIGILMLSGPNSYKIIQKITKSLSYDDLLNIPPFQNRLISLNIDGEIPCRLLSVSFIGEPGFELHLPMDKVAIVYNHFVTKLNVGDWGGVAMNSLRLEKGIYLFGRDMTRDHYFSYIPQMFNKGLPFIKREIFKEEKSIDFIGKESIIEYFSKDKINDYVSILFEVDYSVSTAKLPFEIPEDFHSKSSKFADCLGNEVIISKGKVVGFTTSGGYGHLCEKSIGFGYISTDYIDDFDDLYVVLLGVGYKIIVNKNGGFVPMYTERKKDEKLRNEFDEMVSKL